MTRPIIAGTLAALIILVGAFFMITAVTAGECRTVTASWYGAESGNRTATGEHFDGTGMTAAMPSRAMLGKRVRVSLGNRSVTVRINDIGPAARLRRGIDLSRASAARLGMIKLGVARVCIEVLP